MAGQQLKEYARPVARRCSESAKLRSIRRCLLQPKKAGFSQIGKSSPYLFSEGNETSFCCAIGKSYGSGYTGGILGLSSLVKRVPDKNSYPRCWMSQPINNPRAWGNIAPVVFNCQINLLSRVSTSVATVANVFPGTPPG